jgi:hypothetical protein
MPPHTGLVILWVVVTTKISLLTELRPTVTRLRHSAWCWRTGEKR